MAFIDVRMRPPAEEDAPHEPVSPPPRSRRASSSKATMWAGACLVAILVALVFTLALVSIGDPIVALMVTVVLLLPAASLFGGHRGRHA